MQKCVNCGHQNRPGVVFCENCGASLIGKLPLDTKSLGAASKEEKEQLGVDSSVLTDVKIQGQATFKKTDKLRLDIEGGTEPIVFGPKVETIFGRRDPATGAMPDIDLTPFAGYRMGVSRRHAAIRHGDDNTLDLWDLGSSNGTFLNGQRLSAHRPYRLHDGDELRLGQMIVHIFFKPAEEVPTEPLSSQPEPPETPAPADKVEPAEVKPPVEDAPVSGVPEAGIPETSALKAEASAAPEPAQEELKPVVPESAAPQPDAAKPAAPGTAEAPDEDQAKQPQAQAQKDKDEPPETTPFDIIAEGEESDPDTSPEDESKSPPKPEQPPE